MNLVKRIIKWSKHFFEEIVGLSGIVLTVCGIMLLARFIFVEHLIIVCYFTLLISPFIWLTWIIKYIVSTWRQTMLEIHKLDNEQCLR